MPSHCHRNSRRVFSRRVWRRASVGAVWPSSWSIADGIYVPYRTYDRDVGIENRHWASIPIGSPTLVSYIPLELAVHTVHVSRLDV